MGIGKKFTKDFLVKKFYMEILCKLNPKQNYREFFYKIFCWRSPINLQGNSFLNFKRKYFTKDFLVKKNQWNFIYIEPQKNQNGKKGNKYKKKTKEKKRKEKKRKEKKERKNI